MSAGITFGQSLLTQLVFSNENSFI